MSTTFSSWQANQSLSGKFQSQVQAIQENLCNKLRDW